MFELYATIFLLLDIPDVRKYKDPMRIHEVAILVLSGVLLLSACGRAVATHSTIDEHKRIASKATMETKDTVSLPTAPPIAPTLDSPLTITGTMVATDLHALDDAWLTYTDPRGFILEYPATWNIYKTPDWIIDIRTPLTITGIQPEGVNVGFGYPYNIDIAELIQPDLGTPNEGGYRRFWMTTFSIVDGTGWMYVWGNYDLVHPHIGRLYISFYNETYGAIVTLNTGFSTDDVDLAKAIGLEAIIEQKYPHIQHIIKTFRFLPPLATPTPWPQVQQ